MTPDVALKTLDLVRPVTRAELKGAFRTAAKKHHPDATHRKDSAAFITARAAYMLLLQLVPLAAGEVDDEDIDEVEEVEVEPEVEPTYTYSPPPRPARYRCGRCGKTMGTETEMEGRRMHWTERQDYPGCPPTTRARNAQCQADAMPTGFR